MTDENLERYTFCSECSPDLKRTNCFWTDNVFESRFKEFGEADLRAKINELHQRSILHLFNLPVYSRDMSKYYAGCTYYCRDGFTPGYSMMPIKVMYIGRESTYSTPSKLESSDTATSDYMFNVEMSFKQGVRDESISNTFHKRLLMLTAAILHPELYVNKAILEKSLDFLLGDYFNGRIAFSFLELSKLSNDNIDSGARFDKKLMLSFSDIDRRQHINSTEIEILKPDVILLLNFFDYFEFGIIETALGGRLSFVNPEDRFFPGKDDNLSVRYLEPDWDRERQIPVLDIWHLSSRKRLDEKIITPIIQATKMYLK